MASNFSGTRGYYIIKYCMFFLICGSYSKTVFDHRSMIIRSFKERKKNQGVETTDQKNKLDRVMDRGHGDISFTPEGT